MSVKGGRRHVEHSHVYQSSQAHCNHYIGNTPAEDAPCFLLTARDNPLLGERGVQIDDVRHHGRPNDADREEYTLRTTKPGRNGMHTDLSPVGMREKRLNDIAERNHTNECS